MEGSEGGETSEDGRGKGGKTDEIKIWRKRGMKESSRRYLGPLKVPDSIETRLLFSRFKNDGKE